MLTVEWKVAPHGREVFEAHLTKALHYAPPWLRMVTVRDDAADSGCLLNTSVMQEYRVSTIRVNDSWYAESDPEKLVAVVHEVLHAHIEGMAVVFKDLLSAIEQDEHSPLRKWAEEQWRKAEEGCISDLSRAIAARESKIP